MTSSNSNLAQSTIKFGFFSELEGKRRTIELNRARQEKSEYVSQQISLPGPSIRRLPPVEKVYSIIPHKYDGWFRYALLHEFWNVHEEYFGFARVYSNDFLLHVILDGGYPWLSSGPYGQALTQLALMRTMSKASLRVPRARVPITHEFFKLLYQPILGSNEMTEIADVFIELRNLDINFQRYARESLKKSYDKIFDANTLAVYRNSLDFHCVGSVERLPSGLFVRRERLAHLQSGIFGLPSAIHELKDQASELISTLKTSSKAVCNTVEVIGDQTSELLDQAQSIFSPIVTIAKQFDNVVSGFSDTISYLWKLVVKFPEISLPTVSILLLRLLKNLLPKMAYDTLRIALILALTAGLGLHLSNVISTFFSAVDNVQVVGIPHEQSFSLVDIVTPLTSIYMMMGVDPNNKGELVKAIKDIPHFAKGAGMFLDGFITFAVKLSSLVTIRNGWSNDIASIFNTEYREWSRRANAIMANAKNNCLDVSSLGVGEIEVVITNGTLLHKSLVEHKETLLAAMVLKSIGSLENVLVTVQSILMQGGNDRQMPVTAVFKGLPGMGKTVAASLLGENVLDILLKDYPEVYREFKDNPDDFILCKSKDPWFDELTPKKRVIIFDDFASMRTQTQDDAAWPQLIDACNTSRKTVPVADLNKKGLIRFNQLVTLITTNDTNVNDPLLVSVDAVASRIHFVFTVSVKGPKYSGVSLRDAKPNELDVSLWSFSLNLIDSQGVFHDMGIECDYFDVLTLLVHQARVNEKMYHERRKAGPNLYSQSHERVAKSVIPHVFEMLRKDADKAPKPEEFISMAQNIKEMYRKSLPEERLEMIENGLLTQEIADGLAHEQGFTTVDVLDFGVSSAETPGSSRITRTTVANSLSIGTFPETCTEPERMVVRAGALASTSFPSFSVNGFMLTLEGEAGLFKQRLLGTYVPIPYVMSKIGARITNAQKTRSVSFSCKPGAFIGRVANFLLEKAGLIRDLPSYQRCVHHFHLSEKDLINKLVEELQTSQKYATIIAQNFSAFKRSLYTGIGDGVRILNNIVVGVQASFVECVSSAFQTCSDVLARGAKHFTDFVAEHYGVLMTALGVVAGIVSLYSMFAGSGSKLYADEQDSSANRTLYMRRTLKNQKERRTLGTGQRAQQQDLAPNIEDIADKVVKNMWCLMDPKINQTVGEVVALEEDIYLMNHHFLRNLDDQVILYKYHNPEKKYLCTIADGLDGRPDFHFSFGESKDIDIIRLICPQMPRNANITRHVATSEYLLRGFYNQREEVFIASQRLNLIRPAYDENTTPNYLRTDRKDVAMLDSKEFSTPDGVQTRNDLISYKEPTKRGACGSVVLMGSKIVGIHIGGDDRRGFATKVNSAMLLMYKDQEVKQKTGADFEVPELNFFGMPGQLPHAVEQFDGDVEFVKRPFSTHVVEDIVPFKGRTSYFKPTVAPVKITPESHANFRKKVKANPQSIVPEIMDFVIQDQTLRDLAIPWDGTKKPYPIDVAIRGLPNTSFGPMPTQTSSGFPYSTEGQDRSTIFSVTPEGDLVLGPNMPEVIRQVELFCEMAVTGGVMDVIHMDHVKYENRPLDKLEKARVVQTPMFFHFLLGRIAFGPYLRWLGDTVMSNSYLVGANPYVHWDSIEQKFLEKDGAARSCDGDYSGFDTCHTIDRLEFEWKRVEYWFGADGYFGGNEFGRVWGLIRKALILTSIVGRHIYGYIIERRDVGMASGVSMTTPLNCGVSRGNLEYCYIKAGLKATDLSVPALAQKFHEDVYAKFLGDDTRFAVSRRTNFFDNLVFQKELEEIGYKYVAADKQSELKPFSRSENVTLLKRTSRWEPLIGKYVGALSLEVILNMLCYHIKNKPSTIFDRATSAIMELSLHSDETWNLWFPRILAHVGPGYVPPALTRSHMLMEMTSLVPSDQSLGSAIVNSAFFVNGMKGFRATCSILGEITKVPHWPEDVMRKSDAPFIDLPLKFFDKLLTLIVRDGTELIGEYIDDSGNPTNKMVSQMPMVAEFIYTLQAPDCQPPTLEQVQKDKPTGPRIPLVAYTDYDGYTKLEFGNLNYIEADIGNGDVVTPTALPEFKNGVLSGNRPHPFDPPVKILPPIDWSESKQAAEKEHEFLTGLKAFMDYRRGVNSAVPQSSGLRPHPRIDPSIALTEALEGMDMHPPLGATVERLIDSKPAVQQSGFEEEADPVSLGHFQRVFREGDEEEPVNPIRKPFTLQMRVGKNTPVAYEQSGSFLDMENQPNTQTPPSVEGTSVVTSAVNVNHGKTTIIKDDTVGVISEPVENSIVALFDQQITNPENMTLSDYLAKPTIVKQGNLSTTDIGHLWYSDTTALMSPYKNARLSRVYTLRYDTTITIQLNADKFQSGRYILYWLPMAGPSSEVWRRMHTCHLTTITQLPHVEFDVATETHATLTIPYVNTKPYMEMDSSSFTVDSTPGIVGLYTYSALDPGTGGSSTCGYTIIASQKNLSIGSLATSQSASDNEQKAAGLGPISGALDTVSKVSGLLTSVPGIGLYAKQVSWTAAIASKVAHTFGWSKPIDVSPPERMERRVSPLNHSADGSTSARVLATVSTNSVADPRLSRRNVDEMTYEYLKRIPAYIGTFSWTTSNVAGDKIYETIVRPQAYSVPFGKGSVMPPITFLAYHHTLWRGGVRFRFKLVKTQFHRGRLLVYVDPGVKDSLATLPTTELLYREIVDISETSQFEICVPYNLARAWISSGTKSATIGVFVLDPLVAPTTVTSTVKILVEVCGDDTLEFAIPFPTNFNPYAPAVLQSGEYTVTDCVEMGGSKVNFETEKYTTGEKLTSFRQLIKQVRMVPNIAPNFTNGGGAQWYPYLLPFADQLTSNSAALINPVVRSALLDVLACCYALSTGSKRHSIFPFSGDLRLAYSVFWSPNPSEYNGSPDTTQLFKNRPYAEVNTTIEGNSEIQTPVWNPNYSRSAVGHLVNNTTVSPNNNDVNLTKVSVYNWGSASNAVLFSSAGDDYNLSLFVGIPALTVHTAT